MKGFTLIELIVVIGIFTIVSALSVPFIQSFQTSSNLHTHANTIVRTLRRAQQQAIAGRDDSSWGVYFDSSNNQFLMFLGDDYATRDEDYDQETEYSNIFIIDTDFGNEIYFSIYSGQPSEAGTITISSPNNQSKVISIGSLGMVQINE